MTAISKRQLATVIAGGAALSLVVGCIGTLVGTDAVASARLGARYTGRLSFVLFAALFALGPQRGDAGVRSAILGWPGLASAHLVHLGFLLRYLSMAEHAPAPGRLAGGVVGYVVLLALAAGHLGAARAGSVSPRLARGSHLGGAYLTVAFVLTYLPRITKPQIVGVEEWWGYAAMLAVAVALPVIRWVRWRG